MEGLNALESLEHINKNIIVSQEDIDEDIKIIEKELKALEIIKNKKVNLEHVKFCENYLQYKIICSYWDEISVDEYNLLAEVLK